MNMEEVLRIVRKEEGIWFDGVGAVKRHKRVQRTREDALLKRRREDDSAGSSGSSSTNFASDSSSSATSPVLSPKTLKMTPSPPSLSDGGVDVRRRRNIYAG